MRTFGWSPTEEEVKDLVNVIDQDGNGDISFNEFIWLMTKWVDIDLNLVSLFKYFHLPGWCVSGNSKILTLRMR
jgi:Ca2+-binding EF-hand superfamily protein